MFNSSSHILIRVQFFQSYWKKVQIFDSFFPKKQFFRSYQKRVQLFKTYWKTLIHWVILKKFYWKKCSILRVICWKRFSSLSNILKRVQFFESNWKEGFHSVSHINKKGSIVWVISQKFNSLSRKWKKVQFLESYKEVQFFESYAKKRVQVHWVISKKSSVLRFFCQ